jgi:DNA-binding transcriptional LysR family regulator
MVADVPDLQAFCLVADLRSITAASRVMGESKATISRRISRLEQALDVALVKRTTRVVEPTDDGVAYRMKVGHVLELLAEANDTARKAKTEPTGLLRVTSPPELSATFAPVIVSFAERYPAVHVEMVVTQTLLDLDSEHIDVALRIALQLPDSALIAHKLFALDPVVVASPEFVRRRRQTAAAMPKKPSELSDERLVMLKGLIGRELPFRHRKTGETTRVGPFRPFVTATDMNCVKELALAGAGITLLPRKTIEPDISAQRLQIALSDYTIEGGALFLLHHGGRFLPPKVRAFRDHMIAAFRR